jgi:thiol-disulfide isomerase/thioredoxin
MRRLTLLLTLIAVVAVCGTVATQSTSTSIVRDVRATIANQDFVAGQALVDRYRTTRGVTSEMIAALSWLARGTYAAGQLDQAAQYSVDTYDLAVAALETGSLEDDYDLEIALGAAIETDSLVRAARGDRSSAVYFLGREIEKYQGTPIHKRLQKNAHLLSLEGQPAPAIVAPEYLGPSVQTLDELKGNVVLLFFWAHWCPDCKAQAPAIGRLLEKYRSEGLRVLAPTQRFGYIVSGQDAAPDEELRHIEQVRDESYAFLRDEGVPVSAVNHQRYGVSTTPTLVLVDREGIVRLYRPGNLSEDDLDAAIRELL